MTRQGKRGQRETPVFDIVPILEEFGAEIPHRGSGTWLKMKCPFHEDSAPSATVSFQANRFHCWVGCTDRAEDAIGLLMLYGDQSDFQSALAEAERITGTSGIPVRGERKRSSGVFGRSWNF
ncbi:CHC2 zinc finger domain-containing protein [Umezawaea sp. NPDC059074]|uniref:CHC2 zinc finger domain-containing protein n=1 Tax=Umezawaea sp. NPDC059074 TaxID=3346716 RepID=UPI0036C49B0B